MEFNDNLKYGVSQVCFATTFCDKSHDADDASPLRAGTLQRIKSEFDYITARKMISEMCAGIIDRRANQEFNILLFCNHATTIVLIIAFRILYHIWH